MVEDIISLFLAVSSRLNYYIMMQFKTFITGLSIMAFATLPAQEAERELAFNNYRRYFNEAKLCRDTAKDEAIARLRSKFRTQPHRMRLEATTEQVRGYIAQLTDEGTFADMDPQERAFEKNGTYLKNFNNTTDDKVGIFLGDAYGRIYLIAEAYRKGALTAQEALNDKVLKAILHYGKIEIGRSNAITRFHASCFLIPTEATNTYFALLDEMDKAEQGKASPLMTEACDMLKTLGLQAWTQPLRNDETDYNVVQIDRFRNHVWWVGGNALAYRSLLQVAAMYSSIPMIDLLAEVCQKGISTTSQTTYNEAFWTEGFTADGAGWGHGKQCLVWGYPIDGTSSAINMLNTLKGTPWAQQLNQENTDALMNFFRGSNWYYYKGFKLPGLERGSYVYKKEAYSIPYKKMLDNVIDNWLTSFNAEEQKELKQLQKEAADMNINMNGYSDGVYTGMRWFFNNDDIMKKTPSYHVDVNMASVRCDGLESAAFADNYNFYPTDGATLFQRNGNEYNVIMGGWDVTAMPGVTAREGMERLTPVTNWRGYCSKHNFSAGATDKRENGVAGMIFEKMDASQKKGVNDRGMGQRKNEVLYGVKAYKSYFFVGDYMVCLGAGITNMRSDMEGHIRTTIDQTAWQNDVFILKNGKKMHLEKGKTSLLPKGKKATWICQEGKFGYTILNGYSKVVYVSLEKRPTDWVKMNPANKKVKDLPKEVDVLRIWVDHGQKPVDEKYGYAVYMGEGKPSGKLPFEVLQNDTLVQAVGTKDMVQAVFYPNGKELKCKHSHITVSHPCALLIKHINDKPTITVTDATMNANLKFIHVTINGTRYDVKLPEGKYCGAEATM